MANSTKGEIDFTVDGTAWTLVFDFNALCAIEDAGVDVADLAGQSVGPRMLRTFFRIGLEAKHGVLTDLEAGRLIQALGVEAAGKAVGEAVQAAFPPADPSAEGNAPRAKATGTGRKP